MMCELELRLPTIKDKQIIEDFKQEFLEKNEPQNLFGTGGLDKPISFEEWLRKIEIYSNEKTCPKDRIPATQFISIRKSDNKMIGMISIRHYLNQDLLIHGGHIGDCVRPSERHKGYGSMQLSLAIKECKKLKINRVLITCNANNIASAKTIENNGGVLENKITQNGNTYLRYWIEIK